MTRMFLSVGLVFFFVSISAQAQDSVVHCDCVDDLEGTFLMLVSLDAKSGNELWRKKLDSFSRGASGMSTCNSRLVSAQYCVR